MSITTNTTTFEEYVTRARAGEDASALAAELYGLLTDDEKLGLLDGDEAFWEGMRVMVLEGYVTVPVSMGAVKRLGIPGVQFVDGPRGICVGHSTAFPVSMARGATYDVELEERVGTAIGLEGRAQGGTLFAGICINLPRHPAWGRAQETYGEDSEILGEMGAALTRGVQQNLMGCAKHFALNSMENARFSVDVTIDEADFHEYFLPHFKRVVDEGISSLMSAYNSVNGEWAGQNRPLLTDILRGDWGFEGFVMSDFIWGLRDAAKSLHAGEDIEAPFSQQRNWKLRDALADGTASWEDVALSGQRILVTQLKHFRDMTTEAPSMDVVASEAHTKLAREVAAKSMVLLKNRESLLPLAEDKLTNVAVLGRLANMENTGDHGSSKVRAPYVVTPFQGLKAALPNSDVALIDEEDAQVAAQAAADADVAIVVVGYTAAEEGEFLGGDIFDRDDLWALYPDPETDEEKVIADKFRALAGTGASVLGGGGSAGGDRASIRLPKQDVELIRAVAAKNERTIVVIESAGAVIIEDWDDVPSAIVVGWYPGMEGGHALADVVLGAVDASGRLPFSIPTSEDHLPALDINATSAVYDKWFGQRLIDKLGVKAAYPLGFGMSYTTFEITPMSAHRDGESVLVSVLVRNTGDRNGRQVVQIYGKDAEGARHLLGFKPVEVSAGAEETIEIVAHLSPLGTWNRDTRIIDIPKGAISLEVGAHAGDDGAKEITAE